MILTSVDTKSEGLVHCAHERNEQVGILSDSWKHIIYVLYVTGKYSCMDEQTIKALNPRARAARVYGNLHA